MNEHGVLILCLNIFTSVSIEPVRPDLNVSAILSSFSCCLFSEFSKYLRICLEEFVPIFHQQQCLIFSSFEMIKIKIKVKIKTKYFPYVFLCCFRVEPSFTSHAE